MTATKALLLTAMLGLAGPALADSHMEAKKGATAAPMHHDGMAHDKDATKMSAKDMAEHDKMMKKAAKTNAAKAQVAAEKAAVPK